jgi:hypothetical protein
MPNLHNRYKSAERKISQKKTEYSVKLHIAMHVAAVKIELSLVYNKATMDN